MAAKKEIESVKHAIRALKKMRKGVTIGKKLSVKSMIAEGRK